ncbi:ribonuclease-3 family protein [Alkalithermobacter thermoalcaliphilus JW-YL-7 = DSM 7308]|uniref:Mini-ribonuclease 3 n=1 Tax=Alkalithermobacter thermoalcaliphilus JW-YL-7 = DSM 7308 TaxID=1121328 RepID=A0A150FMT7_CLOPD|nr:putative conserved protein UCP005520 [[Clostridium] paradoxum JW-YL-7 = DSM 7308]SHL27513.1 ribonuclease-3 family protein [[Clostridium] paradoxum JW-YL-7 = DSM 7308]
MEIKDVDMKQPLVLAYIGDSVYEVYVRKYLVEKYNNIKVNELHKKATQFVKAKSQCIIVKNLENELTDKEMSIVKRARNQKSNTIPKNAQVIDYKYATAFEALIGYLYLSNDIERMEYLIQKSIKIIEQI